MARKKKTTQGSAVRDIGIDAKPPTKVCSDPNCCWHGKLPIRGKILEGTVVSARAQKTVVVQMQYYHYLTKFQSYERRHSNISAYNPECISAKEGNVVRIAECRPLSKTKAFVVIEVVKGK